MDVAPNMPQSWERVIHSVGNPKIPSLEEAMREALTLEETERFVAHLRPQVEAGLGSNQQALAYLWATKL